MCEEDEKIIRRLKYYNDEDHLAKRIVELQHCIEDLRNQTQLKEVELEERKKEIIGQDKYIDKLKKEYDNQLQQKENIINEVREKIKEDNLYLEEAKKMYIEDTDDEMLKIHALQLIINDLSHIDSYLKILDKENK